MKTTACSKPQISRRLLLAGLTALVFGTAASPAAAQSSCLSDAEVQQAVRQGKILSLPQALARAGLPPNIKILSRVRVCRGAGGLTYYVSVLEGGSARQLTLPAS